MDEFLLAAIAEARKGMRTGGIPIGAVLVKDKTIIGRGHNKRVQEDNPILHAEIDCLASAGRIGSYKGATLYSTLMPCYLCAGAIVQFGINKVVAGESKNFSGAVEFLQSHGVEVVDAQSEECIEMMDEFILYNEKLWHEDIGKD